MAQRVDREVAGLFNAVQRSSAATERCAKHLWRLAAQAPEEVAEALSSCVELVLTAGQVRMRCGMGCVRVRAWRRALRCTLAAAAPRCCVSTFPPSAQTLNPRDKQKSPPVERCVRFLGALAATAPASDAGEALVEHLLRKLGSHLTAADRSVRFRAAQSLACALHALPADARVDEALADDLAAALRERLRDKGADVRLCAARALGRLPAVDEVRFLWLVPAGAALVARRCCFLSLSSILASITAHPPTVRPPSTEPLPLTKGRLLRRRPRDRRAARAPRRREVQGRARRAAGGAAARAGDAAGAARALAGRRAERAARGRGASLWRAAVRVEVREQRAPFSVSACVRASSGAWGCMLPYDLNT